ncbi:MAG: phosphatase PAP2 family protein [Acidimicrobiales bacterium]|nr:phosphatase PAP2 family protein [Acidimicrobiales bacterium]
MASHAAKPVEPAGTGLPAPERSWAELARQVMIVGLGIFLYFAVRGQTEGAESAALENGQRILEWEESVGLDWELGLQAIVTSSRVLTTLSNWAYIWLHWPVIIIALIWLHRNRRAHYILMRNAMFVSGLIGLAIFIRFPVAPPRMLDGFVDTVTELSTSYRILQPPDLVNKYAAVPSLHVGWNLLVGVALYLAVSNRFVRAFAVLSPITMSFAIIATANHYVIDGILGAIVAGVGLGAAWLYEPLPAEISYGVGDGEIVENESVDAASGQLADEVEVVGRPGEDNAPSFESRDHTLAEKSGVHDGPIDIGGQGQSQEQQHQFESVTSRSQRSDPTQA